MLQKMNLVAAEFRRASNKQMAETTKRTINENARIEQTVIDMEDVSTRVDNENEHIHDGVGFFYRLVLFIDCFILFFKNNHLHMGIDSLRNKEQQHAFQHATSAEV
jgi:hypothetical protein